MVHFRRVTGRQNDVLGTGVTRSLHEGREVPEAS
jgi:hypothetical protein